MQINRKIIIIVVVVLIVIAGLAWAFTQSIKPLPGVQTSTDGTGNHLPQGTKIDYDTNPPTHGSHYPNWITKGFYEEPRLDGNIVHSLEHGYIIFNYDCDKFLNKQTEKSVVEKLSSQRSQSTVSFWIGFKEGGSEGTASASLSELPEGFQSNSCNDLKNQIKQAIEKNGDTKLIANPRVGMDSPLILTAWGRMLKLNNIDQGQINDFIHYFRNNGPECTNEP